MASVFSSDSMRAIPSSAPRTKQEVESASPTVEESERIVTLSKPFSIGYPVEVFRIW